MKVIGIYENDSTNSITGFTYSIFFSGCNHHCDGCFSPQTWNYDNGKEYSVEELFNNIKNSRHNNVSLIGGDPFYIKNRIQVIELIKLIKEKTNKKVYVWTGYLADEVSKWIDLNLIDYLIDGKFNINKRDIRLPLRGSKNQRIFKNGIDVTNEIDSMI
jgi:anaerobic ribonucleoside-triphosphate reductase activating protein